MTYVVSLTWECFHLTVQFSNGNLKHAEQLDFAFYKHTDEEHPRKKSRRMLVRRRHELSLGHLLLVIRGQTLHSSTLGNDTMQSVPSFLYRLLNQTDCRMLATILERGR